MSDYNKLWKVLSKNGDNNLSPTMILLSFIGKYGPKSKYWRCSCSCYWIYRKRNNHSYQSIGTLQHSPKIFSILFLSYPHFFTRIQWTEYNSCLLQIGQLIIALIFFPLVCHIHVVSHTRIQFDHLDSLVWSVGLKRISPYTHVLIFSNIWDHKWISSAEESIQSTCSPPSLFLP